MSQNAHWARQDRKPSILTLDCARLLNVCTSPTPPSALFPWKGQYTLSFPSTLFPPFIAAASAIFLRARPPTHGTFPEKKSKTDRDSVVRGGAVNKKSGKWSDKRRHFFSNSFAASWHVILHALTGRKGAGAYTQKNN